jgi:hypothetical protein
LRKTNVWFSIILSLYVLGAVAYGETHPKSDATETTVPGLNSSTLTPTQVVDNYYFYIGKKDLASASQFLSADLKHFYRRSPDSDFNNVSSLSDVIVKGPYNIRGDDKFKDEIQVVAGLRRNMNR